MPNQPRRQHPKSDLKKRAALILRVLKRLFPDAGMALRYTTPWELLFAVMLSAQCTDKKVNEVTGRLFKKYPTLSSYVMANQAEFEKDIYETGFFRQKAKNILATARILQEQYQAELPRHMDEMIALPGVGRKTANVVLGNAYGIVEGIAVDTHVRRLTRKYGLTRHADVKKIERDLMDLFAQKEWFRLTYLFIEYGRKYCPARKHDHERCPLTIALARAGY